MAKQINRKDIVEDDVFALIRTSAESAIEKVNSLNKELTSVGTSFKDSLGKLKTDNTDDIAKLIKQVKELSEYTKQQTEAISEQEKITRELEKTRALKKKSEDDELARLQKLQTAKQQAYEKEFALLVKSEAEIKRLDAVKKNASDSELLRLEKLRLAEEKTKSQIQKNLNDITQAKLVAQEKTDKINTAQQKESDRQLDRSTREANQQAKAQEKANREAEKAKKLAEDQANAYKKLERNTRELKNISKQLGAEMLELERDGRKNTQAYRDLERQYKDVTKSALEGDKALKRLDQQVGDNFRSVGNYERAVRGLRGALTQLGLAFGVFDAVRYIFDTQVKLDSLNLSLQNVSGSATEYTKNFEFLVKMSKSYGQDLLVLIDTYKSFIASTESSNLSLAERKRIYESIIKAGSALALSNQDTEGALRAVSQMFSKGNVQAEELRGQLGERLPGAFGMMAKSMGVSEEKLNDLLKKGLVLADDVMPAFATELEIAFGSKANSRLKTLGGSFNVLKTELTLYFDNLQKGVGINQTLAEIFLTIAKNLKPIISLAGDLVKWWLIYNGVIKTSQLATSLMNSEFVKGIRNGKGFSGVLDSIKNSASNFSSFLKQNVVGILALVVTEFVATELRLKSIRDKIKEYRQELSTNKGAVVASTTQEKIELEALFKTLRNTNYESQRRQEIIDEINSKYGTTIKNLKDEKLFTDQLNLAYQSINETLDKRLARDKARIGYETTQRQLSEAKLAMDIAGADLDAFNKKNKLVQMGLMLTEQLGAKGKTEITNIYQETIDTYNSIKKLSDQAELDYKKILTIKIPEKKLKNYEPAKETKDVLDHTKAVSDMNIKYSETNEYLSRQLELIQQLNLVKSEYAISLAEEGSSIALEQQIENIKAGAVASDKAVTQAIQSEWKARIEAENQYYNAIEKIDANKIKNRYDKQLNTTFDELAKNNENIEKRQKEYDLRKLKYDKNVVKKNLGTNAKENVKAEGEWLLKEKQNLADAQIKIDEEYEKKVNEINANREKEIKDINLKEEIDTERHKNKIAEINANANKKIRDAGKEMTDAEAEYNLNKIKSITETANQFVQDSLSYFIRVAETRMQQLDNYMGKLTQQMTFLEEKVASGSITAQESLAVVEKEQQEVEKRKIKEQRKQQRLQMAQTIFNAYNANVQSAKVGENALTKTLSDVAVLSAFIGALPTYFDGTDTTIADSLGKPQLQGRDGYIVRVDGSEKVLNPQLSKMTGDMTTYEIAKLAEDKLRGNIISRGEGGVSIMNNTWQTELIVSELQDLKNTIRNKPETNIEVGEILGGVMKIVETKKQGNFTNRNITRLS